MSKIKRKLIAVLCAVMMFSTVITGYAASFGDLVLTTEISDAIDEIVVYSSDFSDGTYERAAFADDYAPADLAGKDFIPVYTNSTEVPDASKLCVSDETGDTYAGNLLREDKNYNYHPTPSGWYPETQNTDIVIGNDDGNKYIYTADEPTNPGKPSSYYAIRKTIQNFYNDYGPGKYKIRFKAKSMLSQPRPNGYYDFGLKIEASNYGKYTNSDSLNSYATLATQSDSGYRVYQDWKSYELSTTIPELGESAATNKEFFTNDVFSIRIGSWNSEGLMPFAIDNFEIIKVVEPVSSIVSAKGKSVTLSHTIYNNAKYTGDTTAKDAVVITALYDGDSKLVTADYAEVTGITDTATATTTISVPNDADETYYSKSFLWNDFSEVIPYSLSTDSCDKNIIENGGFEILSGSTSAAIWNNVTLDSANAHTGKYAVKVTKTGNAAYNKADIYSILKENGVGTYKVSFYVKTDCKTSLNARCLLRSGKTNGSVKDVVHQNFNITASEGWKKMEYTGTIASAADINEDSQDFFVGFAYGANHEGISLWFDDIRIEKIN